MSDTRINPRVSSRVGDSTGIAWIQDGPDPGVDLGLDRFVLGIMGQAQLRDDPETNLTFNSCSSLGES